MDPKNANKKKSPFKLSGERIALLLGGILIGALVIGVGFKVATPIVKKVCHSILEPTDKLSREARVVSVEAVIVKPGTISKRITTVGKLRANDFVTIRSEMQGRIKEIVFKEGTMVKKGDVLIRFDDEELQAELTKAEADVEYRQVRFGRFETLQTKGLGRGTEYDQERGQLNMAKAQLEVAKAKLAKATIYAPFDGKIGLIDVSPGAIVDTQKELVTIVDFDPMKIDFKVPEKYIHDIGVGQTAEVKLDSIPDQTFQATVEAIDSRIDPQTHSIAVRATIPNEDGKLQTGLFGSVSVIIGVKNDALLVPESALGREGDIEYVWVAVNGKSGRKRVLTGTKENGQAEITAGLRPDEIVVTSGQLKLGEGTAVKISNMGGGDVEVTDEDDEDEPKKETPAKTEQAKKPEDSPAAPAPTEEPKKETATPAEEPKKPEASPAAPAPKEEPKVEPAAPAKTEDAQKPEASLAAPSPTEEPKVEPAPPTKTEEAQKPEASPAVPSPKEEPKKEETAAVEGTPPAEQPKDAQPTEAPKDTTTEPAPPKAEEQAPQKQDSAKSQSPTDTPKTSLFGKTRDFVARKFREVKGQ